MAGVLLSHSDCFPKQIETIFYICFFLHPEYKDRCSAENTKDVYYFNTLNYLKTEKTCEQYNLIFFANLQIIKYEMKKRSHKDSTSAAVELELLSANTAIIVTSLGDLLLLYSC